MAKFYFQKDVRMDVIKNKKISVIGYGNQGCSQALNLRDNGLKVTIGNIKDKYFDRAKDDKFEVCSIKEAARRGDIVLLLLPDEIAPEVYHRYIHKGLEQGNVLSFASGYNITYGYISPPKFIDVVMVAPRMGGSDVRARYLDKEGFVNLVGVEHDHSGNALKIALALSIGIGGTQGALMSSFKEETIVDLFGEQVLGMSLYTTQLAFDTMVKAGCSPEASLLELYMSEEIADVWKDCAKTGLWKILPGCSTTAQYGQLTRGELAIGEGTKNMFDAVMDEIKSGDFAREWTAERKNGLPLFQKLWKRNLEHLINKAEESLLNLLKKAEE